MQTKLIRTHNSYHLGDNLVHLHFLRKVALANPDCQFVHAARWQYRRQLEPVVADIPNIKLSEIDHDPFYHYPFDGSTAFHHISHQSPTHPKVFSHERSVNAWRGAHLPPHHTGFWYEHPDRNDFAKFHLEAWFPLVCERMEVENPMRTPADMLFDYPALQIPVPDLVPFDVLVINAPPGSGQFQEFSSHEMDQIIDDLEEKGNRVVVSGSGTPNPFFSVTQIGQMSLHCHTILMVSTGPSWPTWNVWNQDGIKLRVILLDNERVNLGANTWHCSNVADARNVLKNAGLL